MTKYLPSIAIMLIGNEILTLMALTGIGLCFLYDILKARADG